MKNSVCGWYDPNDSQGDTFLKPMSYSAHYGIRLGG